MIFAQIVRAVVFVAAIFMMIPGVINLFDIDPSNNTEAIFMVLIGALLAIAMGASLWTAGRRQNDDEGLWSTSEVVSSGAVGEPDAVGLAGQLASNERLVRETARIVPIRRQWAIAPFGSAATAGKARLIVDGVESARISTTFNVDRRFSGADFVRETRVDFGEGRTDWRIRSVPPAPQEESRFGTFEFEADPLEARTVVVESLPRGGGPVIDVLAETKTPFGRIHKPFQIEADATNYELSPASRSSSGRIIHRGHIERTGFWWSTSWRVEIKEPTPLSVVLAHWHLLLGDTAQANSGASVGGG